MDNHGFDCGSRPVNRDFNALLKTEEYPEITLEVKTAEILPAGACATVAIGIAGKVLEYKVPITIINSENTHFKGLLQLKLSDYELELPKNCLDL